MFKIIVRVVTILVLQNLILSSAFPAENYWYDRAALLRDEETLALGGNMTFLPGERSANELLMTLKKNEIDQGIFINNLINKFKLN